MNVFMFNHTGSLNRGCEAIIRGTINIIDSISKDNEYTLSSYYPQEDEALNEKVKLVPFNPKSLSRVEHIIAALNIKLRNNEKYSVIKSYTAFFKDADSADVCLSVGGDTYCYGDNAVIRILTDELKRRGKKIVLWGASIGEDDLSVEKIMNLDCFDAIFARESLTYENLKKYHIKPDVFLFPDPAFTLNRAELPLPEGWIDRNTVGINLSSIVLSGNPQLVEIISGLIEYILKNTDMAIALIPHVTSAGNDDVQALEAVYHETNGQAGERLFILPYDLNAEQYKGYIARLRFFIGARAHATIAAYTSYVPTIALGYSIKSKGIATDLFGDERFVIDSKTLKNDDELINAFETLVEQESEIKNILMKVIPGKIRAAFEAGKKLSEICDSRIS